MNIAASVRKHADTARPLVKRPDAAWCTDAFRRRSLFETFTNSEGLSGFHAKSGKRQRRSAPACGAPPSGVGAAAARPARPHGTAALPGPSGPRWVHVAADDERCPLTSRSTGGPKQAGPSRELRRKPCRTTNLRRNGFYPAGTPAVPKYRYRAHAPFKAAAKSFVCPSFPFRTGRWHPCCAPVHRKARSALEGLLPG